MDADARHIKYLALCCGGRILASHTHWDKSARENYGETLKQIFSSAGWSSIRLQKKSKLELKSAGNVYCMELDAEGRVYCAVVTEGYPVKHVFSSSAASSDARKLMLDFRAHVSESLASESLTALEGGLQRTLRGFLDALAVRFDDLEAIDKMVKVQSKLNNLKAVMTRNLSLADERQNLLESTQDKTAKLADSAKSFYSKARTIKTGMCCAYYRTIIIVVAAILLVAAVIILILNYAKFHWW